MVVEAAAGTLDIGITLISTRTSGIAVTADSTERMDTMTQRRLQQQPWPLRMGLVRTENRMAVGDTAAIITDTRNTHQCRVHRTVLTMVMMVTTVNTTTTIITDRLTIRLHRRLRPTARCREVALVRHPLLPLVQQQQEQPEQPEVVSLPTTLAHYTPTAAGREPQNAGAQVGDIPTALIIATPPPGIPSW